MNDLNHTNRPRRLSRRGIAAVAATALAVATAAATLTGFLVSASVPVSSARAKPSLHAAAPSSAAVLTSALVQAVEASTIPSSPPPAVVSHPSCSPARLGIAQRLVDGFIGVRLIELSRLHTFTVLSQRLAASDRATLQAEIAADQSGIQALEPQVGQASTCAQVVAVAYKVVVDFRVFYVMAPKTDLVIAADIEGSIATQLTGYYPRIEAAIDKAKTAGRTVTQAEQAFSAMQSQLSATHSQLSGLVPNVLAQMPSGSPGNWPVFVEAHGQVLQARNDLASAVTDLHNVVTDLRP